MGLLLNTLSPAVLYEEMAESTYFVDKTAFIGQMLQRIGTNGKYVCITRPRRFGKTVMANMLGAFLTKSATTKKLFAQLNIGRDAEAMQHINQYNVIYIDFSRISSNDYQSYIDNIAEALKNDLHKAYPDVDYRAAGGVAEDLERITAATGERFIFIFDEWDAIFHAAFISEDDRKKYLLFLKDLLKDRVYVQLAYMTGVLPISKYTSGSELNTFAEYNMATIVNLIYLAARDRYNVQREDKAGTGYVDFIFYPYQENDDCLILELKVDHTPEEAIEQIKRRQYALNAGTLGDGSKRYQGRILAVGIGYSKKTKQHQCKVEVLQE